MSPMHAGQVGSHARDILESRGGTRIPAPFWRKLKRRQWDINDVRHAIRHFRAVEPEVDRRSGNERWNIIGPSVDGLMVTITVDFETATTMTLVSIKPHRKEAKR
jgi:uncharacterized DUF497 family protein